MSGIDINNGVSVLSLYDGMSCAMLAMIEANIPVLRYDAYETNPYAIQTSVYNFPDIYHHGDVFGADFADYKGVDFLIGGSPCTYWSSTQKNHRETTPEGCGWDLSMQFKRAIKEAQPRIFIYENTGSMTNKIREGISAELGVDPISVNSGVFSAQSRQRDYWVGVSLKDGSYKTVKAQVPPTSRLTCSDILDKKWLHKEIRAYPVNTKFNCKAHVIKAQYQNTSLANILCDGTDYQATGVAESVLGHNVRKLYNSKSDNPYVYAIPTHFDNGIPVKAISPTDGKEYDVYEVRDSTIKYSGECKCCDLPDGLYIIRKLTISECKRLQTIPESYKFPVSEKQAYRLIGNGFTCSVIAWLIKAAINSNE